MRGSDSITINELERMTNACSGDLAIRDKTLCELFAATGLRVSEIASLRVAQVVVNSKALDFLHLEAEHTKRKRGGKLPLNERVKAMLEIYCVWLRQWYQGEWLFPGYADQHLTSRAIQKVIKRLKQSAMLSKKVTPHSLRKHFINRLLDNKTDIRVVRSLSRHANLESLHAYVEENEGAAIDAVEALGKRDL